ncbi:MAG: hypothetical protein DRJ68_05705 [Thermoprotei archaeon]|nr:MAG: hypothetical protein DRJ62_05830 [Thermoprotei archaeon]RLF19709.1 MAG: hypothetical protein DRJ68_05705 [Thermoprotei archaeon]
MVKLRLPAKRSSRALLALVVVLAVFALYAFLVEPNLLVTTTELDLEFEGLPDDLAGFRIVQVSDMHFGMWHLPIRDSLVLSSVEGLKPDVIVVTGDLICRSSAMSEAISFVAHLTSIAPTYVIMGNWDYWSGANMTSFREELERVGAVVLVNQHVELRVGSAVMYIIGVDDPYTWRDDLDKAMSGVPSNSFKLLLAHSPQIIDRAAGRVDLILAGHTHGGQVKIPLLGPLFVPLPGKYRQYVEGLFSVNGTLMYVNRGVGTSLMPIRFLTPPEVTLIVLLKP